MNITLNALRFYAKTNHVMLFREMIGALLLNLKEPGRPVLANDD
jgi:hypothetical protein